MRLPQEQESFPLYSYAVELASLPSKQNRDLPNTSFSQAINKKKDTTTINAYKMHIKADGKLRKETLISHEKMENELASYISIKGRFVWRILPEL